MKAFAFAGAVRSLLMISFIVIVSVLSMPGYTLCAIFLVSEFILLIILLIMISPNISFIHWTHWDNWLRMHTIFGSKVFFGGVLVKMNTRVDILMLGFFLSDQAVGIYTFAAMFAEGLYLFPVVIRDNMNPILVQLISDQKTDEIKSMVHRTQRILYPVMAVIILLTIILFPFGVEFFNGNSVFIQSWPILIILSAGILINSGYTPFDWIMIQAGLPEYHTVLMAMAVGSNVALNGILIPIWGIHGAAIATGSSFVLAAIYLNIMVKKQLKFNLR